MAARPSAADPAPDDVVDGRYRLVEVIARGGSATVWRARDERLSRAVAVKLLSDDHSGRCGRDEARALAQLSHPHIAEVFDAGVHDGRAYLALELVDGRSLADVLARGDMPWPVAVAVAAQCAAALAAAHSRGLVHRDITPGNIMLTPAGITLIDFGISAVIGDAEIDADGGLRGTPNFAAPERLTGRTVDPPSDMYSFGVVLYRMLAGRLPRTTPDAGADPLPLPSVDGLPAEVSDLCMRCLAHDPAERPSAAQAAQVLHAIAPPDTLAHFAATTVDGCGPVTRVIPVRPRRSPLRRAGLLAAVGAAAVGVWMAAWAVVDWGPGGQPTAHQATMAQAAQPPRNDPGPACVVAYQLLGDDGQTFQATATVAATRQPLATGWELALHLPRSSAVRVSVSGSEWRYDEDTIRSTPQRGLNVAHRAQLRLAGRHIGPNLLPMAATAGGRTCSLILLGPSATPSAPQVVTVTDGRAKAGAAKGSSARPNSGKKAGPRG